LPASTRRNSPTVGRIPKASFLGDELERIGFKGPEPVGQRKIHAFFELHIEQGPILEAENIECRRRHPRPGPALVRDQADRLREPRRLDADAAPEGLLCSVLPASSNWSTRSASAKHRCAVATVGVLNTYPNSRNVIPGEVFLTVDFRHPLDSTLSQMDAALRAGVAEIAGAMGLTYTLETDLLLRAGAVRRRLRRGGPPRGAAFRLFAP